MTRARCELMSLSDTPWYHVVSRCVRRAFLCGEDSYSGRSYEHRRGWIEARVRQLSAVFAVDVASYAVMSNHYHIVVKVDPARAAAWSDEEVLARWTQLFTGPVLVQRALNAGSEPGLSEAERDTMRAWAATYRARLADLSWYMRVLNETIARKANAEDGVRGHFWEGRFKSQALLDEQAILSAMAYVDLNPIRAGIAKTPEASAYTSVEARLHPEGAEARMRDALAEDKALGEAHEEREEAGDAGALAGGAVALAEALRGDPGLAPIAVAPLMPFDATGRQDWAIPFAWADYLDLVETLGRCAHPHKRGAIPASTPRLLERLGIDREAFIAQGTHFLQAFGQAVGKPARLAEHAAQRQAKYLRGMGAARRAFEGPARAADQTHVRPAPRGG